MRRAATPWLLLAPVLALLLIAPGALGSYSLGRTGSAVNVTLLSYLDQVHIGVNLDPAAVTDPERFLRCYREGWDEILAAGRPA